ncbi:MAG: aspartate aminotransferase family protein [Alphaproteobacteria bacterium]
MEHVFHRFPKSTLPVVARGAGMYVYDTDGKAYLDACGGAAVSCLGHSDEGVKRAIVEQLDRIPFAHTAFYTSEVAERLADRLTDLSPGNLSRVYFTSGGSEATETALKMARQYFVEKGEPDRRHIITRRQSYHGNTLGALAAGGNQWRRAQFEPLLFETHHIAPCYEYRDRLPDESPDAYGLRVADELETKISELGAETVIAFIAETVVGATSGAVPPTPGYFKRIRDICDRHGILLILDEVMCGTGRTGTMFACEQDGIAPDLLTMAKGLGAGYQPIGAVLVGAHLFDAFRSGSGFFQHGHTYMAHPTACAASLAVMNAIEERDLLANVRDRGAELRAALEDRFGQHPHIGDIRGRGLFIGLEIVRDRDTKEPFDGGAALAGGIKASAMAGGLMIYPMGGTIDGSRGAHILLAPPYIMETGHVAEIVERLGVAIDATIS